jgi:hypothetical protein
MTALKIILAVCAVLACLLAAADAAETVAAPVAPYAIAKQKEHMDKQRMDAARACEHSDWPAFCRRHWGER